LAGKNFGFRSRFHPIEKTGGKVDWRNYLMEAYLAAILAHQQLVTYQIEVIWILILRLLITSDAILAHSLSSFVNEQTTFQIDMQIYCFV
jgi:hypothetical protein